MLQITEACVHLASSLKSETRGTQCAQHSTCSENSESQEEGKIFLRVQRGRDRAGRGTRAARKRGRKARGDVKFRR